MYFKHLFLSLIKFEKNLWRLSLPSAGEERVLGLAYTESVKEGFNAITDMGSTQ